MIISVIVSAGSERVVVEAGSVIVAVTVKTSVTTTGASEEVAEIGDEENVVKGGIVCSADEKKASEDMEVKEIELGEAITIAVSTIFISEVMTSVTKMTSVGGGLLSAESRGIVRANSAESSNTISTAALRVSIEREKPDRPTE